MLDGRVEVITGRERRRRWSTAVKLRIVAEATAPGARLAEVARRHEVSRGLLWQWCAQVRRGELRPEAPALFVPVRMEEAPPAATALVEAALHRVVSSRRARVRTRSRWSFRTAAGCGWALA